MGIVSSLLGKRRIRIAFVGPHFMGKTTLISGLSMYYQKRVNRSAPKVPKAPLISSLQNLIFGVLEHIYATQTIEGKSFPQKYQLPKFPFEINTIMSNPEHYAQFSAFASFLFSQEFILQRAAEYGIDLEAPLLIKWLCIGQLLSEKDFQPSPYELMMVQWPSVGKATNRVDLGICSLDFVDFAGRLSEREKWKRSLKGMDLYYFVISSTSFAQNMLEDANQNRMVDAFEMLEAFLANPKTDNTKLSIVITKADMFPLFLQQNIKEFKKIFPRFDDSLDPSIAIRFIGSHVQGICKKYNVKPKIIEFSIGQEWEDSILPIVDALESVVDVPIL